MFLNECNPDYQVATDFLADVDLSEYHQPMYWEASAPWEPKRRGSTLGNLNDAAAAAAGALAAAVAADLTAAGSNGKAAHEDDVKVLEGSLMSHCNTSPQHQRTGCQWRTISGWAAACC